MNEDYAGESIASEEPELEVTDTVKAHLTNAAKWGKFLAIIGFVGIGLTVLLGLFFGAFMNLLASDLYNDDLYGDDFSSFAILSPIFYTILYIVIAAVYFFPVLYLYKFSSRMLRAIPDQDQYALERSLGSLNRLFKFMGIVTIVILALYGFVLFFVVLGGLGSMMF
jgi:hypothetical protein